MNSTEYVELWGSVEELTQAARVISETNHHSSSKPLEPTLAREFGIQNTRIVQGIFKLGLPIMIESSVPSPHDVSLAAILDGFRDALNRIALSHPADMTFHSMSKLSAALYTVIIQPDQELVSLTRAVTGNLLADQIGTLLELVARLLPLYVVALLEVDKDFDFNQELMQLGSFLDGLSVEQALCVSKWVLKIALILSGEYFCHEQLLAEAELWGRTLNVFFDSLSCRYYNQAFPSFFMLYLKAFSITSSLHESWLPALRLLRARLELILDPFNADYSQVKQLFEVDALDPYVHLLQFFEQIRWLQGWKTIDSSAVKETTDGLVGHLLSLVHNDWSWSEYSRWTTLTLRRDPQLGRLLPSFPHVPLDDIRTLDRMKGQLDFTDFGQLRLLSRIIGCLTERAEFPSRLAVELTATLKREAVFLPSREGSQPPILMLRLMLRYLKQNIPNELHTFLQSLYISTGEGARVHVQNFGNDNTWNSLPLCWNPDLYRGLSLERKMARTRESFDVGLARINDVHRGGIMLRAKMSILMEGIMCRPKADAGTLYSAGLYQMGRWLVELARECRENGHWKEFWELQDHCEAYENCRRALVEACTEYAPLWGLTGIHNAMRPEYPVIYEWCNA